MAVAFGLTPEHLRGQAPAEIPADMAYRTPAALMDLAPYEYENGTVQREGEVYTLRFDLSLNGQPAQRRVLTLMMQEQGPRYLSYTVEE